MRIPYSLLIALTACVLLTGCSTIPDPYEQNERIGGGINLGNALEAPREGEWGVTIKAEYFELIREAGFQSVRIPVRWSAHAPNIPPYPIRDDFMERVDWAIRAARGEGLNVVVNMHHYEELMKNPEEEKDRFVALWKQIAKHCRNYPSDVMFEILNEPSGDLTAALWNEYLLEALAAIRETNPDRTVIIGTANWGGVKGLDALKLPVDDRNIIVTVHYYEPFHFTHQGATWVEGSSSWLGTTWEGTEEQKTAVREDFARIADWSRSKNRPIYVGEFGVFSTADMESRVRWTSFVARECERRNFSWAYWEFCSGFGIYNAGQNTWNVPLAEALVPGFDL